MAKKNGSSNSNGNGGFKLQEGDLIELNSGIAIFRDGKEIVNFPEIIRKIRSINGPEIREALINGILCHPQVFGPLGERMELKTIVVLDKSKDDGRLRFVIIKKSN